MRSTDISITVNGKRFLWQLGFSELALNQQVAVENYLRFALKSLEKKRSGRRHATPKSDNPVTRVKRIKLKKPIEQSLEETAQEVRTRGPLASRKRRESQMRSGLSKSFEENVRNGTDSLKPMTKLSTEGEWARNRNETMVWLVYKLVSLAHARLVLYTFTTRELDGYTFDEITFIVEYVAQNHKLLYCEALETETEELVSAPPRSTRPSLLAVTENSMSDHGFPMSGIRRPSSSPGEPGGNVALDGEPGANTEIDQPYRWQPEKHMQPPMDQSVDFTKLSILSKIYQSKGQLELAKSYLRECYDALRLKHLSGELDRSQIICRLCDILCAEGYCLDAREKIEGEIDSVASRGKCTASLRLLNVSLVEVDITEGRFRQAFLAVQSLKQTFDRTSLADVSDQWLHMRSVIASARLLHYQFRFEEAIDEWEEASSLVGKYRNCFKPEGFLYGLIQFSISVARIRADHFTKRAHSTDSESWCADTKASFDKGCVILTRKDPNYWIPTILKIWIPDLLSEIESMEPTWATTDLFFSLRGRYSSQSDSKNNKRSMFSPS